MQPDEFRQLVGSLISLKITRPDLSFLVGVISQFMARPTEEHLHCAQHVLRYVSGTKDRGLLYRTGTAAKLVGYTDADWAGNAVDPRPDMRSLSGVPRSRGAVRSNRQLHCRAPKLSTEERLSRRAKPYG